MAIRTVAAQGYRSLRRVHLPLDDLTVFIGANGVGKTNLYKALRLLQASALGTFSQEIAAEGGMSAALWAGVRRAREPVRLKLSAEIVEDGGPYRYELAAGLVPQTGEPGMRATLGAAFVDEAQIKEECLARLERGRQRVIMQRSGPSLRLRDPTYRLTPHDVSLLASESALAALDEPAQHPELYQVRRVLRDCAFLDEIRTDREAPVRKPALAVTATSLTSDGANLAAVFATLAHIRGDVHDVQQAVAEAFPGAVLDVPEPQSHARFGLVFPEHPKRVFGAEELSDGTIRYLALAGALLAYRPPGLIALNEPEASLHPDLLEPLARLIARAARRTKVWVVTHSEALAAALARHAGATPRRVIKVDGETRLEGQRLDGSFDDDDEPGEEF